MKESAPAKKFKVLFLCTGNSARSILAEYFLRRLDPARFESFSAGANPKGHVNPYVLELLKGGYRIDASGARSKSSSLSPGSHQSARVRGASCQGGCRGFDPRFPAPA